MITYKQTVEATFAQLQGAMITTDACVTEALYLLYRAGGWKAQHSIRQMFDNGFLQICPTNASDVSRALAYMERFQDQPCDYADATLLVAAEDFGYRSVFTIDRHFYAYRLTGGEALKVLP